MVKLKSLIEQIESTPVSIGFLKKRVPEKVAVYAYQQLKGKSRSELFKKNKALIVLIPKKNENAFRLANRLEINLEMCSMSLGIIPD